MRALTRIILGAIVGMHTLPILASSWSPTLLVNTEAFQIIDEGDGTTDVTIQFGDALNESIAFERTNNQFSFSDDIYVSGNVTATGTFSGSTLTLSNLANCDQIVTNSGGDFSCGSVVSLTGANLAAVQVRRDSNFTLAAAGTWTSIGFNNVDIESSPDVIRQNTSDNTMVDVLQDGFYLLSYHVTSTDASTTPDPRHDLSVRIRRNAAVTLSGSVTTSNEYSEEFVPNTISILSYLQNGDSLQLQALRTTANEIINETVFTIVKLNGVKGEKGDKGDTGDPGQDGVASPAALENVFVNQGGDTMTGSLVINGGTLNVTGDAATNSNFAINNDNEATDAILTFGNDVLAETLRFSDTSNAFEFSDDLIVNGDLQVTGNILTASGNAGVDGQVLTKSGSNFTWTSPGGSSALAPYVNSDAVAIDPSTTATVNIFGQYFTPSSVLTIPSFGGTLNSYSVVSPTQIDANLTSDATLASYDIVVTTDGTPNTTWTGNGVNGLIVQASGNGPAGTYTESFEGSFGNWVDSGLNESWLVNTGATPSNNTGPTGASVGTSYIYAETSGNGAGYPNRTFGIQTDYFNVAQSINFDYHMYGATMGTLQVQTLFGGSWTTRLTIAGQQHANDTDPYTSTSIDVSSFNVEAIRFLYTSGTNFTGDIAIDNVIINSL